MLPPPPRRALLALLLLIFAGSPTTSSAAPSPSRPVPHLSPRSPSPTPTLSPPPCHSVLPARRIIGGAAATLPFLAALWDVSTGIPVFRCTATRLSAAWLLSAAHCNVTAEAWVAILAGSDATAGPRRRVLDVHKHPDADIALLRIDELPADGRRAYARVNAAQQLPLPKAYARAAGYGVTVASEPGSGGMHLNSVDVPMVSPVDCKEAYGNGVGSDDDSMMCAGKEGCDSCLGDSGGPLFQFDGHGRPVVVGVVSAGQGCGEKGFPGLYARVSIVVQWMRDLGAEFRVSTNARQVFKKVSEVPLDNTSPTPSAPPEVTSTLSSTPEPQQQHQKESEKGKSSAHVGRETAFALIAVAAVAGLVVFSGAAFGWWRWRAL